MTEEDIINNVFVKLDTYGLRGTIPGIKDINAMRSLLSIGGVLLFIPYVDDFNVSYIKDPSILDANNNAVYSDGFVKRPSELKGKSFVYEDFDLVSYASLYAVFRFIYRNDSVADVGDIVLNMLYTWLKDYRGTVDNKIWGLILDALLGLVKLLQTGFTPSTLTSFRKPKLGFSTALSPIVISPTSYWESIATTSTASMTTNVALQEEFKQSVGNIFNNYTTLFTSFGLEKTKDTISIFSEGSNPLRSLGKSARNSLVLPGEFFKLFYEVVMLTYEFSNLPLPVHIPKEGWRFGIDKGVIFSKSSKASNMTYLVDIDISLQEVMRSSFVNIDTKTNQQQNTNQKIPKSVAPGKTSKGTPKAKVPFSIGDSSYYAQPSNIAKTAVTETTAIYQNDYRVPIYQVKP
jgi:hypothetical protein